MSRHRSVPFARLALLQDLAGLERRRELEQACLETDRREAAAALFDETLLEAERDYAALHAAGRFCLSRMTVAAAIVSASATAASSGKTALSTARAGEIEANAAWHLARHRAEWFSDRDRDQRKGNSARRDERAETETRSLRLSRQARDRA